MGKAPHQYAVADPAKLIAEMGGERGFDPVDPTWYELWKNPNPDHPFKLRLWSFCLQLTVHRNHRTPYLSKKDGTPLSLTDLAGMMGVTLPQLSKAWNEWEQAGILAREGDKLLIRANCKPLQAQAQPASARVTQLASLPAYLRKAVGSLNEEKRGQFMTKWCDLQSWGKEAAANAISWVRQQQEQSEDTICAEFGLPKRRMDGKEAKAPPGPAPEIPQLPDSISNLSVQSNISQNQLVAKSESQLVSNQQLTQVTDSKQVNPMPVKSDLSVQSAPELSASLLSQRIPKGVVPPPRPENPRPIRPPVVVVDSPPSPKLPEPPGLRRALIVRTLNCSGAQFDRLVSALGNAPVRDFALFLDKKRKEISFGPGMLPELARQFVAQFQAEHDPELNSEREAVDRAAAELPDPAPRRKQSALEIAIARNKAKQERPA